MHQANHLTDWNRKVHLFRNLDSETLLLLQEKMGRETYRPGEILCTEGESGDRMFVVESGTIAVLKRRPEHGAVIIATLEPGDVAGTTSMFTRGLRSATLEATTEVRVQVLEHAVFRELLETHNTLATAVLSNLSEQLHRGGNLTARLLSSDVDPRYRVAFFDAKPYMRRIFEARNRLGYAIDFYEARLTAETAPLAVGADVVCAFVNDTLDRTVLKSLHASGIGLIALRCAGHNNVDLTTCEELGLPVVRVPAYSPHAVAEHTVALMMTLNRKVHRAHNRVREGNFSLDGLVGFDIHGRTAGIIGAGKIGKCLIEILAGFGCELLVHDKVVDDDLVHRLKVRYVALDELFARSDIISLHAPLVPATRHMIDDDAIQRMKPGVMIINTSRGALIDTRALLAGLKSGRIGYAGLDVYEEESDYFFEDFSDRVMTDDLLARLTTFNNVVVTSHQAFLTQEALTNIADTTLENIREFEQRDGREPLTNRVVG